MIQDIAPHQFHNEYKAYEIQNGDYVLFYRQRDVLLRYVDEQIVYPKYEEVSDRESRSYIYLFSIDAQRYYFCDETDETLMEAYQFVNIQKMRKGQPKHQAFAGVTGLQLAEWYRSRRFCGRCGTRNDAFGERANGSVSGVWADGISEDFAGCDYCACAWQQNSHVKVCGTCI